MEYENKKLKEYLGEELYNILKKYECYIAGGFIRNLFTNTEINDVDIYFRNKKLLENLLFNEFEGWYILSATKKAITFKRNDRLLQLIHIDYYNDVNKIFDSFDFTCCMGAYDFKTEEFVLHKDFLKHNSQRILKFNSKTLFPIVSALRINKYIEKGYKISRKEFVKVMLAINNLSINNLEELTEQLGGMYGENLDDIFSNELRMNFNLSKAIEELDSKEFIYTDTKVKYDDWELFVLETINENIKYCNYQGKNYVSLSNRLLEIEEVKSNYIESNINDLLKFPLIKYKIVKKKADRYFSYHDSCYEYKLKHEQTPSNNHGLHILDKTEIKNHTFYSNDNKAILKCLIESIDDLYDVSNQDKVKKLFVLADVTDEFKEVEGKDE